MNEEQALLVAFGFGWVYNWFVGFLLKTPYAHGLNGIFVAVGVLITLLISGTVQEPVARLGLYWLGQPVVLTNQQHAMLYELKFFIATGAPMLFGSLRRHWQTLPVL